MDATRKITIEVPADLLARAQRATGKGITETVRNGLESLAKSDVYKQLLALRGKVNFDLGYEDLKDDR